MIYALCGLVIIGGVVLLLATRHLERFESFVLDQFFRRRASLPSHPAIVCINIDEESLQAVGRLPWPRKYYAQMAQGLEEWGTYAAVFDLHFGQPSAPEDDETLRRAFQESSRVYLPVYLELQKRGKVWVHSLPAFEQHATGLGHINVTPDADGILRRVTPFLHYRDEGYPQLAVRVACDYLGMPWPTLTSAPPWPLDREGNLLVNWAGKWYGTFPHYSYVELLRSFQAAREGRQPTVAPEELRGKICLIGLTAMGMVDIKATPIEPTHPGTGIQASILNSILTNRFVKPASFRTNALCVIGMGVLTLLLVMPFRGMRSVIAWLIYAALWIQTAFLLFRIHGVWVSVVHPLLAMSALLFCSALVSQAIEHRERLRFFRLASRDGLTGLYTIRHARAMLLDAMQEARKARASLAVLLIDVDNFKSINDTHGHQVGDAVLKQVAEVIQTSTRMRRGSDPSESDFAARYGGEEFLVLLRHAYAKEAAMVGERIRHAVEQARVAFEERTLQVTISIGAGVFSPEDPTPDAMIRRADEALYQAKAEGKNRVCVFRSTPAPPAEH
ncbi:MAG: CHASE2 domain-containing protein [Candidatus Omnitrophica bacterium]|nr:CHASE2 domain-containing protein [Candidatus Omnitrophota bacterium]MBI3083010.1 CHASE2 domain-containing protein [Candidatus Omnitrophota bacterium]